MSYRFHRAASSEHLDQVAFYESRLPGLGADYLAEFEHLMVRVCNNPDTFPLMEQSQIRKASMRRFPFHVMYMVHDAQVHILAIAHQRRRPAYWVERIGN
jgi:hypothetical protein